MKQTDLFYTAPIATLFTEWGQKQALENIFALACKLSPEDEFPIRLGLAMTNHLLELQVDDACLAAAMLFPSLKNHPDFLQKLTDKLDSEIIKIINGAIHIEAIQQQRGEAAMHDQAFAEKFRKMLLTMINDTRVVLIK